MFSNAFFLLVLIAVAGATARDDYNYGGDKASKPPVLAAPSPSSSSLSSLITSAASSSAVTSLEASSSIVSGEASSTFASSSAIETASASESASETSSAASESVTSTSSASQTLGETDCAAPKTIVRTVTVHDGKQSTKTVTVHDGKPTQVPNGQTGIKDGGNGQGQNRPPPNNNGGNGQGQTRPPNNNGGNGQGQVRPPNNGGNGQGQVRPPNNGGAGNNNGGAGNNNGGGKGGNGNNNGGRPPKSTTTVTVDPTNTRGNQGATTTSKAGNGGNGGGKSTSTVVVDPTKTRGNGGGQIKSTSTVVVDPTPAPGNGNGNGNGQGGDATGTATAGDPTATANPGQGGGNGGNNDADPQSSLNLLPELVQPNQAKDGQETPTAGQVASLKSTNNFINFCATQKDVPLTDGQQIVGGSCNPTPMGRIIAKAKMPTAKFVNPKNFDTIPANQPFTIQMAIKNMETGAFTNPDKTYFGAPAQVNGDGIIIGHSHVTVQRVSSLTDTSPTDPTVFEFFKGMNGKAQNGILTADVAKGLQPGTYRLSSINSAANHQSVLGAVAQRGSLDDAIYFTVE